MSTLLNKPNIPASQKGASILSIIFWIISLVVIVKLLVSIIPAYVGDYQLTKFIETELKETNDSLGTPRDVYTKLQDRLNIEGNRTHKAEDIIEFQSLTLGHLTVHKSYTVVSNFFGNIDLVISFEGEITEANSKK